MKDYEEKVLNIMDSAKDNIRTQLDKAYKSGYEDAKSELGKNAINLAHEERDRAYQQGLEDAWEAARKLALSSTEGGLDTETTTKIFDGLTYYAVFKAVSASEAIAKIKEYEEKQDAIQVGDEVFYMDENDPRVVVRITQMSAVQFSKDGKCAVNNVKDLHKTGRTFPQIAEVLAEMRGDKE